MVTVVETVKLRPDLAVQSLVLPSSAMLSQPVNISANIVELNGDASATTTCVLAIDGNNVDQANNVYVDAGGSISCAFVYTFSTTGSHTIQVTATNVVPADWEPSNNSTSGAITINNPGTAEHAWGYFSGSSTSQSASSSHELWYLGNVQENSSYTYSLGVNDQFSQVYLYSVGCSGSTNASLWQFPVNLTYSDTMDGTVVDSYTDTGISGNISSGPLEGILCNSTLASYTSQQSVDYSSNHWNYLAAGQYYDGASNVVYAYQSVTATRNVGDVTYFSYGYQCLYWNSPSGTCNNPSDYYAWNTSSGTVTAIPVGSTWVPSVTVQDAAGSTFSGSITVPLSTGGYTNNQPYACYNYGPDANGYTYQNCSSFNYTYTQTNGNTSN